MINNTNGMKKFSSLAQKINGNAIKDENEIVDDVNKPIKDEEDIEKESDEKQQLLPTKRKAKSNDTVSPIKELNISFTGKVAHIPTNMEASKALTMFEKVRINKSALWYFIIEKQDDSLQMIKYNANVGVDLTRFINELKEYYVNEMTKLNFPIEIINSISNISISGKNEFTIINNIPKIKINDKFLISKITEDLITLLKD
jgi:hypothetical protein